MGGDSSEEKDGSDSRAFMSRDRVKLNGGSLYRTPQALLASFGVYKNRVPKEQKIQQEIKGGGRTKGGGGSFGA